MHEQRDRILQFEQRLFQFAQSILTFCNIITPTYIAKPIIAQLVRSGTSIGANYMEANVSQSKKDFISKAEIARKEADETSYWLHLLQLQLPEQKAKINELSGEVEIIYKILGSMCKKVKSKL